MRKRGRPRVSAVFAALLSAAALSGIAACAPATTTPAPPVTAVPIGPTVWPQGTVGKTGLRIDPSLLGRLPKFVDAIPIMEDAQSELIDLDDPNLAQTFDRLASASVADIASPDWLSIDVGHLKDPTQVTDILAAWQDQYATGACAQAGGVSGNHQETISDWNVDVSNCAGGPVVYTLYLGNGVILSMFGLGDKDIGRRLINALY